MRRVFKQHTQLLEPDIEIRDIGKELIQATADRPGMQRHFRILCAGIFQALVHRLDILGPYPHRLHMIIGLRVVHNLCHLRRNAVAHLTKRRQIGCKSLPDMKHTPDKSHRQYADDNHTDAFTGNTDGIFRIGRRFGHNGCRVA